MFQNDCDQSRLFLHSSFSLLCSCYPHSLSSNTPAVSALHWQHYIDAQHCHLTAHREQDYKAQMYSDQLQALQALGFDETESRNALERCKGNLEAAADYLLSNASAVNSNYTDMTSPQMVHANISQYSLASGQSACTCIALFAAMLFLERAAVDNDVSVDPEILQLAMLEGHEVYQKARLANQSSVEHTSASELLEQGYFEQLQIINNEYKQGSLQKSLRKSPQGLYESLKDLVPTTGWKCVVMTKPPETVLLCLSQGVYILIDSHPRPQFQASEAYGRIHSSLDDLAESLETIFASMELGSDVPAYMSEMYNAFDLIPVELKPKKK
jgi:UBA/TS-N domain